MKILYVYDKMPDAYQKYLNYFLEFIKKKLHVKALAYKKDSKADFSVLSYGVSSYFQFLLHKVKLSKFKKTDIKHMSNFDIIHLQYSFLWRKLNGIKNLANRPKIVITLRGGDTFIKPWLKNSWKDFYKNSDHVDAFVVMSHVQKKYLTRWQVPENKIHVIPISFGSFSNAKPKYQNKDVMKLVSAFRMTWEKNITGTVFFAKLLKDRNVDFEFDIYGDGGDLGQLHYLIERYELANYINVKGMVDNDILKEKLVNYDFFVQLSLSDALPTSVIEAQSIGLPCIVSNSGGLPEAVINNVTGIVGDYNNLDFLVAETIDLWNNEVKYHDFSEKAILNANENFSIEVEFEKLNNLYQEITKTKN
jgi:glycosyltransferase involved in cell wall biosynthesis